jgi:hypothetical protein
LSAEDRRKIACLENLDSHMISMAYRKSFEMPYIFPPRATMDVTFVPWHWAPVNMGVGRKQFPLLDEVHRGAVAARRTA